MKRVAKTIKRNKRTKGKLFRILLGTLGANLLGNILTGNRMWRAGYGNKEGKEMLRAGWLWIFN